MMQTMIEERDYILSSAEIEIEELLAKNKLTPIESAYVLSIILRKHCYSFLSTKRHLEMLSKNSKENKANE